MKVLRNETKYHTWSLYKTWIDTSPVLRLYFDVNSIKYIIIIRAYVSFYLCKKIYLINVRNISMYREKLWKIIKEAFDEINN